MNSVVLVFSRSQLETQFRACLTKVQKKSTTTMLLVGALRSSSRSKRPTVGKFKKKKKFLGFLQLDERRMTTCRRYVMRKVFIAQGFFRKHATFTSWCFFCCFFWPNPILHILLFSKGLYKLKISQISQISQFFK